MLTINEQDKAVAEYLKEIGVRHTAQLMAEMLHEEWQHDLFLITFQHVGTQKQKRIEHFDFKTGIGHRVTSNRDPRSGVIDLLTPKQIRELKVYKELSGPVYEAKHVVNLYRRREWVVCPTAASVMYCLLGDMNAETSNFDDWCDEYGYNSDSIAHLNIYKACLETARKINQIFTNEQQQHLAELLEDY